MRFRKNLLTFLLSFLPVKHRDLFTRHGRLRLRYILGAALVALFFYLPASLVTPGEAALVSGRIEVSEWTPPARVSEQETQDLVDESSVELGQADPDPEDEPAQKTASLALPAQKPPVPAWQPAREPPHTSPPSSRRTTLKIGDGDTLSGLLGRAGVPQADIYEAIKAMAKTHSPRKILPGQKVEVSFSPAKDGSEQMKSFSVALDPVQTVRVRKSDSGAFTSDIHKKKVVREYGAASMTIDTSLYQSAIDKGVPAAIVAEAIRIYSWDVDFQRDIRKGDKLNVLYDSLVTEDGVSTGSGDVLYASLMTGGREIALYRYEMSDGRIDYFGPDGQSIRKALMKTPVDGARISSGYGMRRHPVLGYSKMHKGMDFAAPRGTPIYAAGDGVIERIGPFSSYGNYIRLRHNSRLSTAYAHMKGFKSGLRKGARVKQGQVIGYIGTTGRSTGPHLHYEVLVNGKQVNPNSVDLPKGEILKGEGLKKLHRRITELDTRFKKALGQDRYAEAAPSDSAYP